MRISKKAWAKYIRKLAAVDQKAADMMTAYIEEHGMDDADELIRYAYALATKYGEAAAAAACEMYDATAAAQGASVPPAEPAPTATYGEVAKAVNGTKDISEKLVPQAVSRTVKMAGADTMLQNAERDGAQFAWVPMGDTCAFCLTLASRGWQYMSKDALKGGHAEHIHANCDCQYAIRFDGKSGVSGYDPEKYRKMYYEAEGSTPAEKIRAMRRKIDAEHREELNEQKSISNDARVAKELLSVKESYSASARPGIGQIIVEDGVSEDRSKNEIMISQWLFENYGGDICVLAESKEDGVKSADYRWNGKLWDLKTISTDKATDSAIRHGFKQIIESPGGIILNCGERDPDLEVIRRLIESRAKRSPLEQVDVMVLSKGRTIEVFRYIKSKK